MPTPSKRAGKIGLLSVDNDADCYRVLPNGTRLLIRWSLVRSQPGSPIKSIAYVSSFADLTGRGSMREAKFPGLLPQVFGRDGLVHAE